MMQPRQSIGLRLTLLFAAVSTTILLVLGVLIGRSVEQHFVEQDMELLTGKLRLAGNLLTKLRTARDLDALPGQIDDSLVGHHGLLMLIGMPAGQTIFITHDTTFPPALLAIATGEDAVKPVVWSQAGHEGERPHRGIASRMPTGIPATPHLLVAVGVDISHHMRFMESFRWTLWAFIGASSAIAGLLGWAVVRRGLAPLHAIRQGASEVTASRLDYRIRLDAVPTELADLAQALNDMLARLEDSFRRLKDFSSDLAHELRTPISNLMTQTQVALSSARGPDEYRDILASNAEEFDRLARMIADMLFLAQADHGLIVPNREPVDLAAQVSELFDFFDALAEEKHLRLAQSGEGRIQGDRSMLRRALANLLSNAIRHTPPGGRVVVRIATADGATSITVSNTGEPIAPEHAARIFDRFYRADASRQHSGEGAGLGLAITRSIVLAHGGRIDVASTGEGVAFNILFAAG